MVEIHSLPITRDIGEIALKSNQWNKMRMEHQKRRHSITHAAQTQVLCHLI